MNKKIFARLLAQSQNDLSKITQPFIKETFGVEVKRCDTIEQYVEAIDDASLNRYFSKYWQNDMKKWRYTKAAKKWRYQRTTEYRNGDNSSRSINFGIFLGHFMTESEAPRETPGLPLKY